LPFSFSIRGAKGGYQLRVPADEIKAGDIIRLLEGPITIVESIELNHSNCFLQQLTLKIRILALLF
jgi:DNA-binding IscR family transcriptional regulator